MSAPGAARRPARTAAACGESGVRFDDGKDAGALRTIGEVARALGLRPHVLRYWEEQFPMLRPLTRAGGRRYYRAADIALLIVIDRLVHREGYTIRGARQALMALPTHRQPPGDAPLPAPGLPDAAPPAPATPIDETPEAALLSALLVLRNHLESIRNRLAAAL